MWCGGDGGGGGRRVVWRHQPSFRRVRSPGLEAGLVKPTQPTILGWPHQPSVLRVRSPGLEAGLVKPTQPTAAAGRLAENARMNEDKGARTRAIAAQVLDAVLHRGRSLTAELAPALPALAVVRERAPWGGS